MAITPKDAKYIADQEERATRAAEKRAQAEQDAAKYEKLKLKDQGISLAQYEKALAVRRKTKTEEKRTYKKRNQIFNGSKIPNSTRDYEYFKRYS